MTKDILDALQALAEKATQERWVMNDKGGSIGLRVHSGYQCFFGVQRSNEACELEARANAAFIEAANPPAILSLIARIRELEGKLPKESR